MAKIYLAPDDEITSVIEKLKSAEGLSAVLVVPKNATLMQSVINVRLIKKKAAELGKTLGVVTTDSVSRHLASQVGLAVYASVEDVPRRDALHAPKNELTESQQSDVDESVVMSEKTVTQIDGVPVHSYERQTHGVLPDDSQMDMPQKDIEPIMEPPAVEIASEHKIESAPAVSIHELDPSHAIQESALSSEDDEPIVGQKFDYSDDHDHHQSRLRPPRRSFNMPPWLGRVIIVFIALILLGGVVSAAYFPTAEVILHVPTENTKKSITLLIDAGASVSESTTIIGIKHQNEAESTGEAKASGKKPVGEKAKGTVTISNSWSTDTEKLPKNTEIISADKSLSFRTVSDAIIAGATVSLVGGVATISAGKTDVAVIAGEPGDQYNIGPSKFAIQGLSVGKSSKITGASSASMSGGTTKELTVVAEQDVNQATDAAKKVAEETAKTNLKNALPEGEMVLDQTLSSTLSASEPNQTVGAEAEMVSVAAKASVTGYGVHKSDIEKAIQDIFQDGLPTSKAVILPDVATVEWTVKPISEGKYELAKEIEGQIIAVIDQGKVRAQAVRKLKTTVSTNLVEAFSAESASITVKPTWWPLTPVVPSRITVKIQK